ncbi:hypothetical protein [Shivajiella indica]|uniref:Uncharacterized protein n=1 Tax=Shivajiella indica TaxID=872115 RepID=A0ABW5BA60_9BACT
MDQTAKLDFPFWENSKSFFEHFNQQTELILQLFTELCNAFPQTTLESFFANAKGCKVSKGNQLEGMPYQVLDIIRDFDLNHGFNIRLLNWWGYGLFIFITYGSDTAKSFQRIIPIHFEGYSLSKSSTPYEYKKAIIESETLDSKNLGMELRKSKHVQIWKKLPVYENPTDTLNALKEMIQSILDIHT